MGRRPRGVPEKGRTGEKKVGAGEKPFLPGRGRERIRKVSGGRAGPQALRGHESGLGRDPLEGIGPSAPFPASSLHRLPGMVEPGPGDEEGRENGTNPEGGWGVRRVLF